MFDLDNWQEIWHTITRNKVRSFLTGFGVFWGLFMLVILMGLGNGFRGGIEKVVDGVSLNAAMFWSRTTSEPYKGFQEGRSWRMKNRDVEALRARAKTVDQVSPLLFGGWMADKNVVRGLKSGSYQYQGVYQNYFAIDPLRILYGRVLNEIDVANKRKVCVIGEEIYKTLFNIGEDPIGEFVRLDGVYFQVVGVITRKSLLSLSGDPEQTVFLPITSLQQLHNRYDEFHNLICTAMPGVRAAVMEEEVRQLLKSLHDISPTDNKAVGSFNIEEEFLVMSNLVNGVSILTWIVGLGALFSGIIGISNIMLVTIRERMREIGVRRAIGATPLRIIMQVLSESFVLTLVAGIGGFLLGVGLLELIGLAMSMSLEESGMSLFAAPGISFKLGLAAFGILLVSGLIAGFLPAYRALKIKAIDAIRDE